MSGKNQQGTAANERYFPPPLPSFVVPRPALLTRLDAARDEAFTLVVAPAGFGKTSLLSAWSRRQTKPVAWLQLDTADNNPARFCWSLIAGYRASNQALGEHLAEQLRQLADQEPNTLPGLLLDVIARSPQAAEHASVLVLDQYEQISNKHIHEAVDVLVAQRHPGLHLILSSRELPPFRSAHSRSGGAFSQIGLDELCFTLAETEELLSRCGINLAPPLRALLAQRTGGWAMALRSAVHILQAHPDPAGWIVALTGRERQIAEYVEREVLNPLPLAVRSFLLRTSVLDQLSVSLCAWLLAADRSSQEAFEAIARAMLADLDQRVLLCAVDRDQHAYRHHPLIADALRLLLYHHDPALFTMLVTRTYDWYAAHYGDAFTLAVATQSPGAPLAHELLSVREREVLALVAAGATNAMIAGSLGITTGTVKNHMSNILGKLAVDNRHQAVQRARDLQII